MRERVLLSRLDQRVLRSFQECLNTQEEMLCFSGPKLDQDQAALELVKDKELVVKESFKGGYSLTHAGLRP